MATLGTQRRRQDKIIVRLYQLGHCKYRKSRKFVVTLHIKRPQNLLIMPVKVYVIDDPILISFIEDGDLDGFKEYLDSDDMLDFGEPEVFNSEAEALAFCPGIGYGANERATPDRYPLRSCEPADAPFIEAIENY